MKGVLSLSSYETGLALLEWIRPCKAEGQGEVRGNGALVLNLRLFLCLPAPSQPTSTHSFTHKLLHVSFPPVCGVCVSTPPNTNTHTHSPHIHLTFPPMRLLLSLGPPLPHAATVNNPAPVCPLLEPTDQPGPEREQWISQTLFLAPTLC